MKNSRKINKTNALQLIELRSELELEQASALALRLKTAHGDDPHLIEVRVHLKSLTRAYESKVWKDELIDYELLDESKKARDIVENNHSPLLSREER
jgi:hypothetical protein